MSSGTGWLMISLKKSSLSSILLSHSIGWSGLRSFHQNSVRRGDQRVYSGLPVLILIDQRDGATEQPLHLVAELSVCVAAPGVDAEFPHEIR